MPGARSVRGDVLAKIVEFLVYHENVPLVDFEKPLQSSDLEQILGRFDANFIVRRGVQICGCLFLHEFVRLT